MKQYKVTGMSCAACQARVEKAVSKVKGVDSVTVSLLTNSMGVEGTASDEEIIKAVTDAGYGAESKEKAASDINNGERSSNSYSKSLAAQEDQLEDTVTPQLKKRLLASIVFLCVLMYFSMGHMMLGFPIPAFFEGNHVAMGLLQMILAAIVMIINQRFFISGFKSLISGAPNMDTLVALGSMASFAWSTAVLFMMTGAVVRGDGDAVSTYMNEFYFESAAMILTLITIGKMLEARAKGKTTDALKGLIKMSPKKANIIRDGKEIEVHIDSVRKGDIFVVRPGESIPVDGEIIEGSSAVNEAALTGESVPVDKNTGDEVYTATLNQSGFLKCRATKVGEDTALAKIIQMVSDAAATKAPIAKVADRVSGVFVPAVISIAAATIIIWLILGADFAFALARGISVLVISCPCALGLATPVAIMVGNGVGARNGIMFKTAVSLEELGKTDVVMLDKTGTITKGEPRITDIVPSNGVSKYELLRIAYSLEAKSEHPLANAITVFAKEAGLMPVETEDFEILPGNGLTGKIKSKEAFGGSIDYIKSIAKFDEKLEETGERLADSGKTPLAFVYDGRLLGIIAVADTIKEDSADAVKTLHEEGVHVVMLTGDNKKTAGHIGKEAGVDEVIAGVRPDGKETAVQQYRNRTKSVKNKKKNLKVAMVGDGINDAPALTRADIGIAIGAGTDIAIDAADVVLMKSSLADVPAAIKLSRATLRNIHQNLFWAFFYNVLCIPLAAGVYTQLFGWTLSPMIGAAAMSFSSVFVVTNALRLNFVKIKDKRNINSASEETEANVDIKLLNEIKNEIKNNNMEEKLMEIVLNVNGMMCQHCEARVKKALEAFEQVTEAIPDHNENKVTVKLSSDIDVEKLKKAITDEGYEVVG
jgi:Cu2+-exporting ATPase